MDDAKARAAQVQDKLADLHSEFNQSGAARVRRVQNVRECV